MSEMISSLVKMAMQQGPESQPQQNETKPKTSFEDKLKETEKNSQSKNDEKAPEATWQQSKPVYTDPVFNKIQEGLTQKIEAIKPTGDITRNTLIDSMKFESSRLGAIKEMTSGLRTAPDSKGILDFIKKTENVYGDVVNLMNSNRDLSQGQLLALQARMYMVGQHIDVMSKVIDQMTGGVKTILNTNI